MMKLGHLEVFHLMLETVGPVFIGSGERLTKREYYYDEAQKRVHMLDMRKLMAVLEKKNRVGDYQEYLLGPIGVGLHEFLRQKSFSDAEISPMILYSLDAGEVAQKGKFADLSTFIKGGDGLPYVPGSSIKGALRTAFMAYLMKNTDHPATQYADPRDIARQAAAEEKKLFWVLNRQQGRADAVHDIFKAVRISDSLPIQPDRLVICVKEDVGKPRVASYRADNGHTINTYRECLAPGTQIKFTMTIDRALADRLKKEAGIELSQKTIFQALKQFYNTYYTKHVAPFGVDWPDLPTASHTPVMLGGGAGFHTKTVALAYWKQDHLAMVGRILARQFPKHQHEGDKELGVSPHALKMTRVRGKRLPFGLCRLMLWNRSAPAGDAK